MMAVLAGGCSEEGSAAPTPAISDASPGAVEQEPPQRVEVVAATLTDLELMAAASGRLEAWQEARIRSEIGGRVVGVSAFEGEHVAAGALLVELDAEERRINLEEAEAELLAAEADFAVFYGERSATQEAVTADAAPAESAEGTLAEAERLFAEGLISEDDLTEARRDARVRELLDGEHRPEVQAVNVGLTQAEHKVERARLALERTRITAPFAGNISELKVSRGDSLQQGDECLTLLDLARLRVEVEVLEDEIVWLERGAPATVRVPARGNETFSGEIVAIDPRVDPETGTGEVTVAFENPSSRLLPGMFAQVELRTRVLADRLVVPESAVLVRQGRELVFRVVDDRAEWVYVESGLRSGGQVEILGGLQPGDRVAVSGHDALAHNAKVEAAIR